MLIKFWLASIFKAIVQSHRIRLNRATRCRQNKCRAAWASAALLVTVATTPLLEGTAAGQCNGPLFPGLLLHAGGRGRGPYSVTTGDFNGDGVTDLATANFRNVNISVLLGVGDGTFAAQATYAVGYGPLSITTGDFNGDGVTDLATANLYSDNVSVLLGVGNGTFVAQVTYAAGDETGSVTTGDFNGDGVTDLATANRYSDNVSVLLGVGDGTFAAQIAFAAGARPYSVTTGDFNGDGVTDLATANSLYYTSSNNVSVLLGVGDGTFEARVTYPLGEVGSRSLTTGDFNGDGVTDLATANLGFSVSVLLGVGDGTFAAQATYATGEKCRSVTTGDFNGDGLTDLATANRSSDNVSVLLNQCGGSGNSTVCAAGGTLIEGFGETNDFNATCGSDDVYWGAHGATFAYALTDPVTQFELIAAAPAGFVGNSISVEIEASKENNNGNLSLLAFLFNYATNNYESLPSILPLTTTDVVQTFDLPTGAAPNDFVQPDTNEVKLLLFTIQTSGLPNVRTRLDAVSFNFE